MPCLGDTHLHGLLAGTLAPHEIARVDAHIDGCEACRALVTDLILARSAVVGRAVCPGGSTSWPSVAARGEWDVVGRWGLRAASCAAPSNPGGLCPVGRGGASPLAGNEVGRRYVVLDLIGQGGMGRVYRALDRLTGRTVALKRVALGAPALGPLEALEQEFRALATLRHPNIISVLDYGFDAERRPYLTMELLDTAKPLLPAARWMPFAAQVELLAELLRAIGYLHRRGVLHRDLKPSNILIVDGAAKVLDFGLALSSDEAYRERAAGTPAYMAPELFRGGAASQASDLYAIGVLACEVLAGRHPFQGDGGASALIARVLHQEPDLTRLPPALGAVIGRALCKAPSGRPADALTLQRELTRAAGLELPADTAPARDSYLAAARFIGRDEELGRLCRALDAACAGEGSAWLVGGESGVGKSRLLDELRSRALIRGVLAARGQALPSVGTAYHVWRGVLEILALHVELSDVEASVLGAVLPNLGALIDRRVAPLPEVNVQIAQLRLLRVLREVVRRSRDPVLVLLEDLQWADAESLALLAQVSEEPDRAPLLLVGSYRDDEAPRLPAELPAMTALRLARFVRPDIERLCASMLGPRGKDPRLLDLVARETEGNAFFLVEVMRALAEEAGGLEGIGRRGLPERILAGGVEQVFRRRLARVPAEATPLLRLAAVAGRQLDIDVLSTSGVPRIDALVQACAEAGVLEVREQRWRFGHDKLRERVLAELDPATLRELHARVADGLEEVYADRAEHAARIAYHHREAGRRERAARAYAVAGEAALSRGAPAEAEAMLEQARALHEQVRAPLLSRVRVWRGLAQARFALGRLADTDAALRRVCALAGAPLPEDPLRWCGALGRSAAEQIARRVGLARHLLLDPAGERERALCEELILSLSVQEVYVWLARPDLLLVCTLWGLNLEEALDTRHRTNFRAAMAFLLSYTPLRGLAMRALDHAAPAIGAGTQPEIDSLRVKAILWINAGRWVEAADCAARAVARARESRDDLSLMHCLLQLQLALGGLDEYTKVLEICRELEGLAARTRNLRYATLALLGQGLSWLRLGELARAEAVLARARANLPLELGPLPEALLLSLSAVCALQQGRPERAEELAAATIEAVQRARWTLVELRYALASILDVYLSTGRHERHAPEIRRALAKLHVIARRFPLAEPHAWLLQGRDEWLRGRPARAAASLRRSLRAAERLRSRYERAQASYWLGRLAQSPAGRRHVPEGALIHLRAALAVFERLGLAWEATRARAALTR